MTEQHSAVALLETLMKAKQCSVARLPADPPPKSVYLTSRPRPLLPPGSGVQVLGAAEQEWRAAPSLSPFTARLPLCHLLIGVAAPFCHHKVSAAVTLSRKLPGCDDVISYNW